MIYSSMAKDPYISVISALPLNFVIWLYPQGIYTWLLSIWESTKSILMAESIIPLLLCKAMRAWETLRKASCFWSVCALTPGVQLLRLRARARSALRARLCYAADWAKAWVQFILSMANPEASYCLPILWASVALSGFQDLSILVH